jgi:hypothetical protein
MEPRTYFSAGHGGDSGCAVPDQSGVKPGLYNGRDGSRGERGQSWNRNSANDDTERER